MMKVRHSTGQLAWFLEQVIVRKRVNVPDLKIHKGYSNQIQCVVLD